MSRLLVLLILLPAPVSAHVVGFGLLRIVETAPDDWSITLSVAGRGGTEMGVLLPPDCLALHPPQRVEMESGSDQRWRVRCSLEGEVGIVGAPNDLQIQLRIEPRDLAMRTAMLSAQAPTIAYQGDQDGASRIDITATYLSLGAEHIATGVDHLLFVLGLLLLVGIDWRRMIFTVTAFTAGHSMTLTLATLGYVSFHRSTAEAIIALSIVLIAVELSQRGPTLTQRYPWGIAIVFGLVHGLGFAGALQEIGLPGDESPLALFSFNLGVEVGQLCFVALASAGLLILGRKVKPETIKRASAYTIGIPACYWLLERLNA